MRVFVTGATGWVGSAIVRELMANGHKVVGLARSDTAASALASIGVEVHRGALDDLDSLRSGVAIADGVVHTAFSHDFSKFAENAADEKRAIATLGAALEGSDRPIVITSGVAFLSPNRIGTEDDEVPSDLPIPRNPESATAVLVGRGVKAMLVRLAPSVHGTGDHGFVPMLIDIARRQQVSAHIDDGLNHWPAVHRLDAARLYRLALEKGVAGGRYHAVAEEGVPFKDIAGAIGQGLDIPTVSKSAAEAEAHFGMFARFARIDVQVSSQQTRLRLGWVPEEKGLIADIDQPRYFQVTK